MEKDLPKNRVNRLDNLAHAHKVHIGKVWYEDGVPNPRKPLRGAGTTYTPDMKARRAIFLSKDLRD